MLGVTAAGLVRRPQPAMVHAKLASTAWRAPPWRPRTLAQLAGSVARLGWRRQRAAGFARRARGPMSRALPPRTAFLALPAAFVPRHWRSWSAPQARTAPRWPRSRSTARLVHTVGKALLTGRRAIPAGTRTGPAARILHAVALVTRGALAPHQAPLPPAATGRAQPVFFAWQAPRTRLRLRVQAGAPPPRVQAPSL